MLEDGSKIQGSQFAYGRRYIGRPDALPIVPTEIGEWKPNPDMMRDKEFIADEVTKLFGSIRDAAPDAWGRRVIESRLNQPANSLPESTYLMEAGHNRAGALDIRPDIQSPPLKTAGVHRLEYLLEAAARIEEGLPVPTGLQDIFEAGSGMGGMRPKASVTDAAGHLWLAKFPSLNERLNIPILETATLRLAKEAGLAVPDVRTECIQDKTIMMIRRFDREYSANDKEHRRHMISALTLLGCHESESPDKTYGDIADAIRRHGAPKQVRADQAEMYGRMIFNILVTNDDDHLRNHAFLWRPEGWSLSPLYDVVPRPSIGTERRLHLGVGNSGRSATIDNALTSYARFGLDLERAWEIIDRVYGVVRQWRTYFEAYNVPLSEIEKIASAFRHIDDVCTREARRQNR
ncbi:type II toxin-antitoxin system HipA family toxin [Noviherbaspirillum malthae]|uniref:type II toxin-antitoxin system HipA family toxin n=1 Tax=Noviherbaspirillum malthae TaxID=1260987 RepID=UPI0018901E49|nr:HipA domain-containing protein [Noviherbaspirillum malthae]